jgi:hypothetical protein
MKKYLLIFLLLFQSTAFSQEQSSFEYTKRIHSRINELSSVEPSSYQSRVYELKSELERFFAHKKRVCNGEFSAVILSETNSVAESSNKLTKEERELCFRELKALQTSFINNLFLARKNYLEWGHKKNLEELNKEREKAIVSLKKSFSKKSSKRRRR